MLKRSFRRASALLYAREGMNLRPKTLVERSFNFTFMQERSTYTSWIITEITFLN